MDHFKGESSRSNNGKYILLTDTEGEGQNDQLYDTAMSLVPLSISQIVIYMYAGALLPNEILNSLYSLSEACKRLKGFSTLGHLHLTIRGKNIAVDDITDFIFSEDNDIARGSKKRNAIRKVLRERFSSLQAWYCDENWLKPESGTKEVLELTDFVEEYSQFLENFKKMIAEQCDKKLVKISEGVQA